MKIARHKVGGELVVTEATEKQAQEIINSYEKPDRRTEYNLRGATIEALVIALFEQDQVEIQRLQEIRQQVKQAIPNAPQARK